MRKRILFLLVLFASLLESFAGAVTKKYVTFLTENGMLYFVRPMHMPKCDGNETKYGMTFDITYLVGDEDSVSFTTTIVTAKPIKLDSVNIRSEQLNVQEATDLIYCEPYKSCYVNRIRFYLKWEEWKKLYQERQPYMIDFGTQLRYAFKSRQWKKKCEIMNGIIGTIEINKRQK
jgi:hypothetical protein